MTRVLPGGFFVAVLFFGFHLENFLSSSTTKLDFLYTFLFFCVSFMSGEVLQTLAHSFEFLIDIFFKGYRPSEIFLYKSNPIIKDEMIVDIVNKMNISAEERDFFEKKYEDLPLLCKKEDNRREKPQKIFWRIFSEVENSSLVQRSNISYLFLRVVTVEFLLLSGVFFWQGLLSLLFLALFFSFLWRARGVAKGLIFKMLNVYLKSN